MDVPGPTQDIPRGRRKPGWRFEFGSLVALTAVAGAIGFGVNTVRTEPVPWRYVSRQQALDAVVTQLANARPLPSVDSPAEPTHEILLDGFRAFALEEGGLVLDARAVVFYREAHIPGAISLPRESFSAAYPRLRARLDPYKDHRVAIYCSGTDCPDAELLAEALAKLGFRHLVIYTSGWDEWSRTGLPQETGDAQR